MKRSKSNQAPNQNWLPQNVDWEPADGKTLGMEEYNGKHQECLHKVKINIHVTKKILMNQRKDYPASNQDSLGEGWLRTSQQTETAKWIL